MNGYCLENTELEEPIKLFKMEKHIDQSTDYSTNEIHTTHVVVVEINIEVDSVKEVLDIITKEFEKHPHFHHFSGRFVGLAKSLPNVSFETEKEPRCASPQ
jgi:hypothetical protein